MPPRRGADQDQGAPRELPQGTPRDLHPTSDIRFVMTEVAALTERVNGLITTVDKLTPAFEKALDKQSADVKERIADLKADGTKTRDKLVEVEKNISSFEGSVRVFGKIYALALVVVAALLAWFLKPVTPPTAAADQTTSSLSDDAAPQENAVAEATSGVDVKAQQHESGR